MKKEMSMLKRSLSLLLALVLILTGVPMPIRTAAASVAGIQTVADPQTLTRPDAIYGHSTINTGKVTVGKSVSDGAITVNGKTIDVDGDNNFLVTISQAAQVTGLSTETSTPVDVVFVLDTSGSMDDNDRAETLVTAVNSAISTLMSAHEENRVAVVAFSSNDYGGGTSEGAAANVLSSLAHYTGAAASAHLQWVTSEGSASGNNREYIAGRDTKTITTGSGWNQQTRTVNAYRHGKSGGTNIQAGIVEGAEVLTAVTNTTYTDPVDGEQITRMPFLILVSDGQPTYTHSHEKWYAPESTAQQGPGSGAYEGNGFIAAMTAAYYKGKITEHYYGDAADSNNRCFAYTMGVEIEALDDTYNQSVVGVNQSLAQLTLDPKSQSVGSYAQQGAASYWNYGNTAFQGTKDATYGWKTYWENYQAGNAFTVRVDRGQGVDVWVGQGAEGSNAPQSEDYRYDYQYQQAYNRWYEANYDTVYPGQMYTFTADSIAATKRYVTSIAYNDAYFAADDVEDLQQQFESLVSTIQQKAISVPTKVTTGDHNFDGYVTFTDPIGDYMEVKDMKGVLAGGYFYEGKSLAQKMAAYGTANADLAFDDMLHRVIKTRMALSAADDRFQDEAALDAFVHDFLIKARDSANQANYNGDTNYDNSIVWWGNTYDSGEEDKHMQLVGFADNDSIESIEIAKAADAQQTDPARKIIPEGADYVCRSYFFYGAAGGANPDPNTEYLYFMVRVQRELEAPYKQTVVISAPASLLSMERVLITESFDDNGTPSYTATVTHEEPARVVYEVGLLDSINEQNVSMIVMEDYANQRVNGAGSVNYDAATDTYHFFTNDWDRSESLGSHHRAGAKATFDAAADNPFYTYQEDTLLVDASGNAVTADPSGGTAYYVRTYYEWPNDGDVDGTYAAQKKTALVEVNIPAGSNLIQRDGKWYIPKGAYTAATLVVNGDDVEKDDPSTPAANDGNFTGTSSIVAHPHRTGDASNSHYTVFLGNNGKLSLQADPYEPKKTVGLDGGITDANGHPVKVGDVLVYTVEVKNVLPQAADITVTDYVPVGTEFVAGSAATGETANNLVADSSLVPDSNNVLTWVLQDVPAGATRYVSFKTRVTAAALSTNLVPGSIENTAQMRINNSAFTQSNPTENPVYGKTVTNMNGLNVDGNHGYKVGDTLVYHIRFQNDTDVAADVTVTDQIPAGTAYVGGSATDNGVYDPATGIITWNFADMAAGEGKVVSFRVEITADAKIDPDPNAIQPATGEILLANTASIRVENGADINTNTTQNFADVGNISISKEVAAGGDINKEFTIRLSESTGLLSGKYPVVGGNESFVEFGNGNPASLTIKHGQTVQIQGLPAGAIINLQEDVSNAPGWTPTYSAQSVTVPAGAVTAVSSVTVHNAYTLQPLTLVLKGTKKLTGVDLPREATFGFVAVPDSNNPEVGDPLTGEVTVEAVGSYNFQMSPKTFTKPGTYKYTIRELNGGKTGVTYDPTQYALVIEIADNGDGTMKVASATVNGAAFDMANDALTFTNLYAPEDAQLELTAKKELEGRTPNAGEFSFVLQLTKQDGNDVANGAVYRGINDANGNILFETINYTQVGTYEYSLSEEIPASKLPNVTYDTTVHQVKVEVRDNNGYLETTVTVDGTPVSVSHGVANTGIVFTNSFEPDDVALTLVAAKALKVYNTATDTYDDVAPQAGQFRFQVKDSAGNVVSTGTNDGSGVVTFQPIYFSDEMLEGVTPNAGGEKVKTFAYTISEIVPEIGNDPSMKYDTVEKTVNVTLTHKADGTLETNVGGNTNQEVDSGATFTNYQNPDSVSVTPVGEKTTNGTALPAGLRFSFKVVPVGGTADAATGTSAPTAGVGNSETADITFSSMVYTYESLNGQANATYRYWIMESNAGAGNNGVTYDTTRYLYEVTLHRNQNGRLVASEAYYAQPNGAAPSEDPADYTVPVNAAEVSFTNTYHSEARINLTAAKELTGRTPGLKANEFDFVLHRLEQSGALVTGSEINGTNAADGSVHFATLNYSNDMLLNAYQTGGAYYFSYLMSELKPEGVAVPGVTYDIQQYIVTVKLTNTTGQLVVELAGVSKAVYHENTDTYAPDLQNPVTGFTPDGNTNVTFQNVYAPAEGDVISYRLKKELIGRNLRAGEFEFGLYLGNQLVDLATNDAQGNVVFSHNIPATADVRTYAMTIKEMAGSISGVTYSTQEFPIWVKVTDDGSGKLEATVHSAENGAALVEDAVGVVMLPTTYKFTNTYRARGTSYTPTVKKMLDGRALKAGEFSFQAELVEVNGVAATGTTVQGVNDARGNVVFGALTYTQAGTYLYELTEIEGDIGGISYSEEDYFLKVVVTDPGNGYLEAAGTYYTNRSCTTEADPAVFTNTYVPADATVQLRAVKELTGRDQRSQEFSFVVRKDNVNGEIVAVGSNDASGYIVFSTFNITAADLAANPGGVFNYVMVESDNRIPGVTPVTRILPVTVTVSDIGTGGLLTNVAYPQGRIFQNTYTPAPVEQPLAAHKYLTGKTLHDGEFTFLLKDENGDLYGNRTYTNDAQGNISLPNLKFTKAGTYKFTLAERNDNGTGYTYDSTVYQISVTVTDDGNGALKVTNLTVTDGANPVTAMVFRNHYTPTPIDVVLEGNKTVTDPSGNPLNDPKYSPKDFVFELYDVTGAKLHEATSQADGKITFPALSFGEAGEYRYQIKEKATTRPGYTADSIVWCVHITVNYDAVTGILSEGNRYVHVAPETHEEGIALQASQELEFINVYDPADVTLHLKGLKTLSGRELKDHEFTFRLVDKATGLIASETRNHADGAVNFHLVYSKAGTYEYKVVEYQPDTKLGGVTYSTQTHDVTVTVTDDGSGALKAQVGSIAVVNGGTADLTGAVTFLNTYEAAPVQATVVASKYMTGKALKAGDYTFTLVNDADPDESYTAANAADGTIPFPALTYTQAGVYTYTLRETKGSAGGVTYDTRAYTVTVTVTDDHIGQLHAQVKYTNSQGMEAAPTFHNIYSAAPVSYAPQVTKRFEGGQMQAFTFVLEGAGFATQTKQNDAQGKVLFDALVFQNAGQYLFTITEQADPNETDIRWDTNAYTLTVKVGDDGEGKLFVDDVAISSKLGRTDLVFRNVHEDLITDKDVFLKKDPTVSIDGKAVEKGDVLTYALTYKNYTGEKASVTITDSIPKFTTYVAGSADKGGVYADGKIVWKLENIAPDAEVTVHFDVQVTGEGAVENQATVLEGSNTYATNTTTNPVKEDKGVKEVVLKKSPTVSLEGKTVKIGDVLLYKISYTNADDILADVVITDAVPAHTAYVAGSADNGGKYADGKLSWNLKIAGGDTVTVTFQVEVTEGGVTVENQASAVEGSNELTTNKVSTEVQKPSVTPETGDNTPVVFIAVMLLISGAGFFVLLLTGKKKKSA